MPRPHEDAVLAELHRLKFRSRLVHLALLAMAIGGWTRQNRWDSITVQQLIVEDSLGRPRIMIGAPLELPGRTPALSGIGVAVLSESGRVQTALGAPTPAPSVNGKLVERIGHSSGLMIADTNGDERGGMGAFPDGRANICLDYASGVKEAVCLAVFPNDEMAGLIVNGLPDERAFDRVTALVGTGGMALIKIATPSGRESAILRSVGMGAAELLVFDSTTSTWKNVMPKP